MPSAVSLYVCKHFPSTDKSTDIHECRITHIADAYIHILHQAVGGNEAKNGANYALRSLIKTHTHSPRSIQHFLVKPLLHYSWQGIRSEFKCHLLPQSCNSHIPLPVKWKHMPQTSVSRFSHKLTLENTQV